jgi:pyruvate/2-oxoglutarate dehydrogenase complex dihydrolipoamide dehydrogenase (E3) component
VISDLSEHDRRLIQNVRPPDWINPKPSGKYNLVVLGAGTAGLVSAAIASAIGAKVALIEKNRTGGDCLNTGCVPSKGILRVSKGVGEIWRAAVLGIQIPEGVTVDFNMAMERMRRLRAGISQNDSVERFRQMGIDVFLGEGRFVDRQSIDVSGTVLSFSKGAICTGARPAVPSIPGLEQEDILTSENLFDLKKLPVRLAIIGAGPIGSEMAQAFGRFGSVVSLFERASRILPGEDEEAATILQGKMKKEGIQLYLGSKIEKVVSEGLEKIIHFE